MLRFWEGASGSGKSTQLYKYIISESIDNPGNTYLVIVPEQATLKTQRDIVSLHPRKGILNVDVLSFNRLAHRIFEETGYGRASAHTIDDMGKNLILRRVSQLNKDKLPLLGDNLAKLGYITQVKSTISEFMQYGISVDKAKELEEVAAKAGKGRLCAKLSDINVLYEGFINYMKGDLSTKEELLVYLCSALDASEKIKNCIVCFDGFTGFTPVQLNVIRKLLELTKEVHIALTLDVRDLGSALDEGGASPIKEHELFYLSRHTIDQVSRIADECHIRQEEPFIINDPYPVRFSKKGPGKISFLEANLFRSGAKIYDKSMPGKDEIHIINASNPNEELELISCRIAELVRKKGCKYSDIAIITGDMDSYRNPIERALSIHKIPYFIDKTRPVLMNPVIELMRAMVKVLSDNYPYEAVFRFLKSGITGIKACDVDILENYCLAFGVKGRSAWNKPFALVPDIYKKREAAEKADYLMKLNEIRIKVAEFFAQIEEMIAPDFNAGKKAGAKVFCDAFLNALKTLDAFEVIEGYALKFEEDGDEDMASEYRMICERIEFTLSQLAQLLGDERITVKEFGQLLDAGFDEIRVGIVPKSTDYVQVGDVTRSRLNDIKALFVVGVNDGIIPVAAGGGGLLTDADKMFLTQNHSDAAFAPTAREGAYSQRLYLYMLLSKPTDYLALSYSKTALSGEGIRASSLIRTVKNMFDLAEETVNDCTKIDTARFADKDGGYRYLTALCGSFLRDELKEDKLLEALITYYAGTDDYGERLTSAFRARFRERENDGRTPAGSISKAVAAALYGSRLYASVTRLEKYASCAYEYYLEYGLHLREREIYDFAANDLGMAFHESLERYVNKLKDAKLKFTEVDSAAAARLMEESVEEAVASSDMSALYATKRKAYMVRRIKRIMIRTIDILKYQASKGCFEPHNVEVDFGKIDDIDALNLKLTDGGELKLTGKIDRVDTCREGDTVYVRVIDYKSSETNLNIDAMHEGRQLQLIVYIDAAMQMVERAEKVKAVPAGILYYHIDDPMIDLTEDAGSEEIRAAIIKKLKLKGYVNADKHIVDLMDADFTGTSDIIPVGYTAKFDFNKSVSRVLTTEEFEQEISASKEKIIEMGDKILDGNIVSAKENGDIKKYKNTCDYCEYKPICRQKSIGETGEADNEDEEGSTD